MKNSAVWVPSPLLMGPGRKGKFLEKWQRLLTEYYARAGASVIVIGAHTGQFCREDTGLYRVWLQLVNETIASRVAGGRMFRMATVGGPRAMKMAKIAREENQDLVMVAPTAFRGLSEKAAIKYLRAMAETIPVFGFYLQEAAGGRNLSGRFWNELFEFAAGAKAAPFDRKKTDELMEAAVKSPRWRELVIVTGNDDYIVGDLLGEWKHPQEKGRSLRMTAGMLGHFATDTRSAVMMVRKLKAGREKPRGFNPNLVKLAADVTDMNRALFDDKDLPGSPRFQNAVYGVHYRLSRLELAPAGTGIVWADGRIETGRPGLEKEIDAAYKLRPRLTDDRFVRRILSELKEKYGLD